MIRALIVDDDFRVAGVHAGFVAEVPGFEVVGLARSAAEAQAKVRELRPDLMLLDIYLPDRSGLALLAELAGGGPDALVLSAASDARTVAAAVRAGALNYLVKPFTRRQLADRLAGYARYRELLDTDSGLTQADVDRAYRSLHEQDRAAAPKGQSPATSRLVSDKLRAVREPLSAAEVAAALGISRATAQRYLTALADAGTVEMRLRYGVTGRPEHEYLWASGG
jgi:two-component system CitB family response regulator